MTRPAAPVPARSLGGPRGLRRILLAVLGVAAIVAGDPLTASGQPTAGSPSGSASSTDEARRLFREGVAAVKAGQWEQARDRFERSYRASPAPLTLFNLAGAQRNTAQLVAAGASYRLFLEQTEDGRHEAFRQAAEHELAELDRLTPLVRIRTAGALPADELLIDDRVVPVEQATDGIRLDPGNHVATVRRAGAIAARRTFELATAQRLAIELRLPLPTAPPPPDPVVLTTAPPDASPRSERSLWRSPWFWVITSAVVTGAGAAGYLVYDRNRDSSQDPTPGTLGTIEVP